MMAVFLEAHCDGLASLHVPIHVRVVLPVILATLTCPTLLINKSLKKIWLWKRTSLRTSRYQPPLSTRNPWWRTSLRLLWPMWGCLPRYRSLCLCLKNRIVDYRTTTVIDEGRQC
jgi:hypothetical protein